MNVMVIGDRWMVDGGIETKMVIKVMFPTVLWTLKSVELIV